LSSSKKLLEGTHVIFSISSKFLALLPHGCKQFNQEENERGAGRCSCQDAEGGRRVVEGGRGRGNIGRQKKAEGGRGDAEGGRGRQRETGGGRQIQREEAEGSEDLLRE
jgi:hypothetical protein